MNACKYPKFPEWDGYCAKKYHDHCPGHVQDLKTDWFITNLSKLIEEYKEMECE